MRKRRTSATRSIPDLVLPLVRAQRGRLLAISIIAILGGFAEAASLVLIARNAVASISAAVAALAIGLLLKPLRAAARRRAARYAAANLEFATGLTELASTLQEVRVFEVEDQVGQRLERLNDRSIDRALNA